MHPDPRRTAAVHVSSGHPAPTPPLQPLTSCGQPRQSQREVNLPEDQTDKAFCFPHEKVEFLSPSLVLPLFSETDTQIASAGFHGGKQIIGRDIADTF